MYAYKDKAPLFISASRRVLCVASFLLHHTHTPRRRRRRRACTHTHTLATMEKKMVKILTGSRYRRIDYQHTAHTMGGALVHFCASPRRLMQPADTLSKKLSHQEDARRRRYTVLALYNDQFDQRRRRDIHLCSLLLRR